MSRSHGWAAVLILVTAVIAPQAARCSSLAGDESAGLWLHRNLGLAYFANDDFEQAARELAEAQRLDPHSAGDARNAGVALLLAGDLPGARAALEAAQALEPGTPALSYALGVLEKRSTHLEEARAAFLACRAAGGDGPELAYNLGILAVRLRDLEAATAEFESILALGQLHAPRHYASALYRQGRSLLQLQRREEGKAALREYEELSKSGQGAQLSEEDLEMGELLELQAFVRPAGVRAAGTLPAFSSRPLKNVRGIRWAEAVDLDGDGDRDLLVGDGQTVRDLRWDNGAWVDVTDSRGLAGLLGVTSARALDLDNDGQRDLVRSGGGNLRLHPGMQGSWDPPVLVHSGASGRWAPVDFDHEGDVDIVAAGTNGPILIRNNGDRSFADVSAESGVQDVGATVDVIPADLDDDQDVDFAFLTRRGSVIVAANARGGRFVPGEEITLKGGSAFAFAAGDVDQDGDLDLVLAAPAGIFLLTNDGDLQFSETGPVLAGTARWPSIGGDTIWLADLDSDGLLDLLVATEVGAVLGINDGGGRFLETDAPLAPLRAASVYPVAVAAVDGDAQLDLVCSSGAFGIGVNVGQTGDALLVEPVGVKNNRDGVGTIVELLADSRYVRGDATGGPVHLGLGSEGRVDALRVRWPNGIQQGVTDASPNETVRVEEKAGLVGSCPFLYTWNGERHEFITDILTVTPLGLPIAPGAYVPPDWDEAIRVTSDQMQPTADGFLVAQVTEELREVTYLDQVRLYAIDHPPTVEVQPNEKFKFPPFPEFGVHVLDGARPPVRAIDHRGRDASERLLETDGLVVGDLPLTRYQGITERHSLELDFGTVPPDAALTLHLSGWFHWTNASINIALSQDPRMDFVPPQLEVQRPNGTWEALPVEVGFPGGKTKSIPVDLTGAFPDGRAKLRVWTTLRIYWDRALLQVGTSGVEPRVTMLLPDEASLRFRGHSEPIFSVTGEEPEAFDYDTPRSTPVPWEQHPGLYTREGDVTPLVQEPEDMYVIMASGDECTVRWRADRLPFLPADYARTYFLVFDGWAKDGDPNATLSDRVGPLPFHAMSGYPYAPTEVYPEDPAHVAYQAEWNTRAPRPLGRDLVAESRQGTP